MINRVATRIETFDGARLRAAREAKQWTQGRLAVKVQKGISSVFAWESGARSPEPKTLVRLAKELGIEPADLLSRPADAWTLVEWRITNGLSQRDVATHLGVQLSVFGNIEAAYAEMKPAVLAGMAQLYGTTEDNIRAAWSRSRAHLESAES